MAARLRFLSILIPALVLWAASAALALEIDSVSPTSALPGSKVTVAGSGFDENVRVLLGERSIAPDAIGAGRLIFTVPQLDEGEYILSLRSGDTLARRSLTLQVQSAPPRIISMNPRNLDICSLAEDRRVTVSGENFQPGASLLLDGKSYPSERESEEVITFTPPALDPGVYGIQVVNPDGRSSLPYSLYFNNVPEIYAVTQGENFVNAYQLIIEGKNFQFNSALVVTVYPGDFSGLPPDQRVIVGRTETGSGQERLPGRTMADIVRYVDCNTIVYKRFPYSEQAKEMSLQVINPDGKASGEYYLTAP